MIVCTDSIAYATGVLPQELTGHLALCPVPDPSIRPLTDALLRCQSAVYVGAAPSPTWTHLFLTADSARSQCDQLIALSRNGHDIPDRTVCLARTGQSFHGFKGRPWSAAPGNIHLAVHFAPDCAIERFEVAFTILAALSVVDALDQVPVLAGRSGIRWVNDVVVDDAKLGGVLAYTQTRDRTVTSAVLGIGLNVEVTPTVELTPFVPAVSSIRGLAADGASVTQRVMLGLLLGALQRNYDLLLLAGCRPLLERYRQRSTIIGRECTVCTDESDMEIETIASGRVVAIGDGLELHLEGEERPITRGRLLIGEPQAPARTDRYRTSRMPDPAGPGPNDPEPRRTGRLPGSQGSTS